MEFLRVFYYIFECTLLTAAGPGLLGVRLNRNKIFLVGFIHGLTLWTTRGLYQYFKIPFGSHTILLALILFLLLWKVGKLTWFTALSGTLISFSLLMLGEPLAFYALGSFFKISYDLVMNNILWFYAIGIASNCLLIIALIWTWYRNRIA